MGNTISIGALSPKRDLTFVADTVNAFLLAAQAPKAVGEFINIGTGRMWSVAEMIAHIAKILGRPIHAQSKSERQRPKHSEVYRLLCDARKAKRLLGWSAKMSFDDGLRQTIDWMRTHQDYRRPHVYHV